MRAAAFFESGPVAGRTYAEVPTPAVSPNWRPDLCPNLKIFGTGCWDGYGEFVRVPERAVIPLGPGGPALAIAGGQCVVSIAWRMVNRLAIVRPGDLVLVPSASGGRAGHDAAILATACVPIGMLFGRAVRRRDARGGQPRI